MHKHNIFTLKIESNPNQIHELKLDEEQSEFYWKKIPAQCSRDTLFNVLAVVQKSRPQDEIDFFENILLLTKNEYYLVDLEGIPSIPAQNTIADIFKDISITPERNRELALICFDNTIVSPVRYCGKHFHLLGQKDGGVRPSTICKWAYQEDLFKQLGLTQDPEQIKRISQQVDQEINSERRADPALTLLDVIMDVLKDVAKEKYNDKPNPPFH